MRIVQTLWCGNKNPLIDNFGWINSQSHLMSWALSCLTLKENYEEIILYTDSPGYRVLSEQLQLPYSEIVIQYDNLHCPEIYWAYSKLRTYSLQSKPFIHIDGDVFLFQKLSQSIESSGLITQNREVGSSYYKGMMNAIVRRGIIMPEFLREEISKDSISSFNAGVLGGNDLKFIQCYCQTAFDFINENQLFKRDNLYADVNINILFEQILFYTLSRKCQKNVSTVLRESITDNGYTYEDFCDFNSYNKRKLMHIIGGHKRNPNVSRLLSLTLKDRYPEYFERIICLFDRKN